jgi:LEA14-like dessication related protein
MTIKAFLLLLAVIPGMIFSCATVDEALRDTVRKPTVSFQSAELEALSFSRADMRFVLEIDNPNPVGIRMAGFDYDFQIDDTSFVSGEQSEGVNIAPRESSTVSIPVSVGYEELFTTFTHLIDRDRSTYRIACGFSFDLPVTGEVRIPVSTEGELPVLRLPRITFGSLSVSRLTLTRADLDLELTLDNPNALAVRLASVRYDLIINDNRWAGGETDLAGEVGANTEGSLVIPLSLDLTRVGPDAYAIIANGRDVRFRVDGSYSFTTSLGLIGETNDGFDIRGLTRIGR